MYTANYCEKCPGGRSSFCAELVVPENRTIYLVITHKVPSREDKRIYETRLARAGIPLNEVAWTTAVKCPEKGVEAKRPCAKYIEDEIVGLRPKAVITFGKEALEAAFKEKGHDKSIGDVQLRQVRAHKFFSTHAYTNDEILDFPERNADDEWAISRAVDIANNLYPRRPDLKYNYQLISEESHLVDWINNYGQGPLLAFDIEAGGTDPETGIAIGTDPWHNRSYVIGVSMCTVPGHACFVDLQKILRAGDHNTWTILWNYVRSKYLVLHNGKYDCNFIKVKFGIDLFPNIWADTMLASHNVREWSKSHSLKWAASRWLPEFDGYENELKTFFENAKIPKAKTDYGILPIDVLYVYAAIDADVTLRLYHFFSEWLVRDGLWNLHRDHIIRMQDAYAEMEYFGWGHDEEYWKQLKAETEQQKVDLNKKLVDTGILHQYKSYTEWQLVSKGMAFWDEGSKQVYKDSSCMEFPTDTSKRYKHKNGNRIVKNTYTLEDIKPKADDGFKRTVLFSKDFMGLTPLRLTDKKKEPKVDAASLRELTKLEHCPEAAKTIIDALLELERVNKLLSTYINPVYPTSVKGKLKSGWRKQDGLIHGQFMLAGQDFGTSFIEGGTTSGRISCRDPNLTNMPTRKGGKKNKKQFIAVPRDYDGSLYEDCTGSVDPDGTKWLVGQLDYSQLELRVLADRSGELFMIESYLNDKDLHMELACQLFNKPSSWYHERLKAEGADDHPEHDLAFNERLIAKTSWFAVIYGSGPGKLLDILAQQDVVLDEDEEKALDKAKGIIQDLYKKLPSVQHLKDEVAASGGVVHTTFMRRRVVQNIFSRDGQIKSKAGRQLFNFLIQSTGSDIASSGIFRATAWLRQQRKERKLRAYPMSAVHDSFILAIPSNEVDYVCWNVQQIMQDTSQLPWTPSIPIKVDVEVGPSWGELQGWNYK